MSSLFLYIYISGFMKHPVTYSSLKMHCSFHCCLHSDTAIDRRRPEREQSPAFPVTVQIQKVAICIIPYLVNHGHGLQILALNFCSLFQNRFFRGRNFNTPVGRNRVGRFRYCNKWKSTLFALQTQADNKQTNSVTLAVELGVQ